MPRAIMQRHNLVSSLSGKLHQNRQLPKLRGQGRHDKLMSFPFGAGLAQLLGFVLLLELIDLVLLSLDLLLLR